MQARTGGWLGKGPGKGGEWGVCVGGGGGEWAGVRRGAGEVGRRCSAAENKPWRLPFYEQTMCGERWFSSSDSRSLVVASRRERAGLDRTVHVKLQALVYDILPSTKVQESDSRSVGRCRSMAQT